MDTAIACAAMFAFVFLKAFQQRNVAFDHYTWVIPTSLLMAVCEFWVIAWVVVHGFVLWKVLAIGLSTGLGAMLAMHLHTKLHNRGRQQ